MTVFYASMTSGLIYSVITMPLETAKNRMAFQKPDAVTGKSNGQRSYSFFLLLYLSANSIFSFFLFSFILFVLFFLFFCLIFFVLLNSPLPHLLYFSFLYLFVLSSSSPSPYHKSLIISLILISQFSVNRDLAL